MVPCVGLQYAIDYMFDCIRKIVTAKYGKLYVEAVSGGPNK